MIDPVQQKLAIRMWNDAVTISSLEMQIESLTAEVASLAGAALSGEGIAEVAMSPEGEEGRAS